MPKRFPFDEGNLSASITFEFDQTLSLSRNEIAVLNAQDWYGEPSSAAWDIANRHFDVAFIGFFPRQMLSVCRNFHGAVVVRAFGLGGEETYSKLLRTLGGVQLQTAIQRCGRRFWFGMGYDHLKDVEDVRIAERSVFMPVGLKRSSVSDQWQGNDKRVFFVCPRIGSSPYFNRVYRNFVKFIDGLPYLVGGAQPIAVNDPNVLGFVSAERHAENMVQSRVMFYHSQEPNHIHYHPFEAVTAGMPLVFMAGGMLDRMGGIGLPGRCQTLADARRKIERILADDRELIDYIRSSQTVLLEPLLPKSCEPAWRKGFERIVHDLAEWRAEQAVRPVIQRRKRIAIILPVAYRGGSLRGAISLALALHLGSRQSREDADVVFFHLDNPSEYTNSAFTDLPLAIKRRPFNWKSLPAIEARRAMRYAGHEGWEPDAEQYMVPDDGMRHAMDCDLWLIVSDRLSSPILPLRPVILVVYDYLQRYENLLSHGADHPFLAAARSAEKVLVTTEFTRQDALQYAGLGASKVVKVPMLAPIFPLRRSQLTSMEGDAYFLWTTNAAPHKNHAHATEALRIYYEELNGQWSCRATGVNTENFLTSERPHLKVMAEIFAHSKALRKHVKWLGELPDDQYQRSLSQAKFLWHAGRFDNDTFTVIEAACFGVPTLSSDCPTMREVDKQFSLSMAWMNADDPRQMAEKLKAMEQDAGDRCKLLPSEAQLRSQRLDQHANTYWQEVRTCL